MNKLIEAIERLITDFSGRRLAIWVGVIGLVLAVAIGYEHYTDHFKLARINDQVELLEKLQELQQDPSMEADSALVGVYEGLRDDLQESIGSSGDGSPGLSPRWVQAILGASIWTLMLVFIIFGEQFQPDSGLAGVIFWFIIIILVTGAIGYFLPTDWPTFVTHVGYPLGAPLAAMAIIQMAKSD